MTAEELLLSRPEARCYEFAESHGPYELLPFPSFPMFLSKLITEET